MSALIILFGGFACLFLGYVTYGSWLSKQWGVDNSKPTPAHTLQDGVDYVPAGHQDAPARRNAWRFLRPWAKSFRPYMPSLRRSRHVPALPLLQKRKRRERRSGRKRQESRSGYGKEASRLSYHSTGGTGTGMPCSAYELSEPTVCTSLNTGATPA